MYMTFRAASGAALAGMGLAAFALATDVAGPSWRGFVGLLMNHFFSGAGQGCQVLLRCGGVRCKVDGADG